MAEPSSSGMGRLIGTADVQRAIDATSRTINSLNTAISQLIPSLQRAVGVGTSAGRSYQSGKSAGFSALWGGGTHAPGVPNGGGSTFSGANGNGGGAGGGPAAFPNPGTNNNGWHQSPNGIWVPSWMGSPNGGAPSQGNGGQKSTFANFSRQDKIAFGVGAGIGAASQINQNVGQTPQTASTDSRLALNLGRMAMPTFQGDWQDVYKRNSSALDGADAIGSMYGIMSSTGYSWGSKNFNQFQQGVKATSLANPTISNTQAGANQAQFGTPMGYTSMLRVGIQTIKKGGQRKTTMEIANEILKMVDPYENVRTEEDARTLVYDPMSHLNQTLGNWIANGIIAAEQVNDVKEMIFTILKARAAGMSFQQLRKNFSNFDAKDGGTRNAARQRLRNAGIANSPLQDDKNKESEERQGTLQRLNGFEDGLRISTRELEKFHTLLNTITEGIPGLNTATGWYRGMKENPVGAGYALVSPGGGLDGGLAPGAVSGWSTGVSGAVGGGIDAGLAAGATRGWAGRRESGGGGATSGGGGKTYPSTGFGGVKPWVARAGHEMKQRFGIRDVGGVGTRSNKSDHPSGHALDFMTNNGDALAEYARANAARLGITYVIWAQRIWSRERSSEGWRAMEDRGSATANHFDHVHVSFQKTEPDPNAATAVGRGAKTGSGSGSGGGATALSGISELAIVQSVLGAGGGGGPVSSGSSDGGGSGKPGRGGGGGGTSSGRYTSSAGVEQWRDEVVSVMKELGVKRPSKEQVDRVLYQMKTESSGNPTVVNKWDSNWEAGHPSVGLMQVIKGTFEAYAGPYKNRGPFEYGVSTDPVANIYAALNYARDRYGSWEKAFQGHGYAKGAWDIKQDEVAKVHKGEMVLPKPAADQIRQVLLQQSGIGSAKKSGTGDGIIIKFEEGAIQVSLGPGSSNSQGQAIGKAIASALAEDHRIRALQNG